MSPQLSGETVHSLLASGQITDEQLEEATRAAEEGSQSVLEVLLDSGVVDRSTVVRTAAQSAGLDYVELSELSIDMSAAALLPPDCVVAATEWGAGALPPPVNTGPELVGSRRTYGSAPA